MRPADRERIRARHAHDELLPSIMPWPRKERYADAHAEMYRAIVQGNLRERRSRNAIRRAVRTMVRNERRHAASAHLFIGGPLDGQLRSAHERTRFHYRPLPMGSFDDPLPPMKTRADVIYRRHEVIIQPPDPRRAIWEQPWIVRVFYLADGTEMPSGEDVVRRIREAEAPRPIRGRPADYVFLDEARP